MRARWALFPFVFIVFAVNARAADFSFSGYVDVRLVVPGGERSWVDGGWGKFRFGASQPSPNFRVAEAVGQASIAFTPQLHTVVLARVEPEDRAGLDLLEAYAAWRPQAESALRWSAKAGAFFPPVSVENDDLGWTSPYTLTPSAINSWVGDELRTIGAEAAAEWHTSAGTLSATGAAFCCNEPAGILIAKRGWALGDRPTGLFERVNTPRVVNYAQGAPPAAAPKFPQRRSMFQNIDGHTGWYGAVGWSMPDLGHVELLYYDNNADPAAHSSRDTSWRTRFWSASYRGRWFGATILAQAMSGATAVKGKVTSITDFDAAFILVSYDLDDWRVSERAETFATRNRPSWQQDEDGHAFTTAASWSARSWLRLTGELIVLSSRRAERVLYYGPIERTDTQFQLSARLFL
jgi:hypothetical protein